MSVKIGSALIHVGGCGLISLRCVGLVANNMTRWRHKVSSAWTGVERFIRRPFAVLSACWRRVNISTNPAMAGTVLLRVPSSLFQRRWKHWLALGGMVLSKERRLRLRSSRRARNCLMVSIAHPRMTFCVLQAVSPLRSFLREIDFYLALSSLSLGRKRSSMARKRCRVICHCSIGPPWTIPMNSSRYTSTWARDVARACGDRASQLLSASSGASESSVDVLSRLVSAKSSR